MNKPSGQILIIGQGIAGTSLAWQCIRRGFDFTIIDDGHRSSSSLAAAGLFNPIILKRRRLTWNAARFMADLKDFYAYIEQELDATLIYYKNILRRVSSVEELNDWQALKANPAFAPFLGEVRQANIVNGISSPFGWQDIVGTGFVDVESYLSLSREYFSRKGLIEEREIKPESIELMVDQEAQEFKHIILANGYRSVEGSKYFSDLPFSLAKGHTMEIKCDRLELEHMINGPCFIIPLGNERFRIGSTYSWNNFNNDVEEKEIQKLKENFEAICPLSYSIEKEWAGVRPATKDRKPLLGCSNVSDKVMIFNGLGSRAIMTTPTLSAHLLDHILLGKELWDEVSLSRF